MVDQSKKLQAYVPLENAILKATSETLQNPDENLFKEACEIINSRADMPKEAIKSIKKRLMIKNGKVFYLTLDLLEMATFVCGLPFHTQIATKDFLMVISNLLFLKQLPEDLFKKLIDVIQIWYQVFEPSRDLLLIFFEYYENFVRGLQKKNMSFPSGVESKYSTLSRIKYSAAPSNSSSNRNPSNQSGGARANELSGAAGMKTKEDFDIIKSNILFINELIDAHDPKDDVKKNDTLLDLIANLKSIDDKIKTFISNMNSSDEKLMGFCLEVNDDLNKTLERYEDLKKNRKPKPFNQNFALSFDSRPPPQQKPSSNDNPFGKFNNSINPPGPSQPQNFGGFNVEPPKQAPKPAPQNNLIDLLGGDPEPEMPVPVKNNNVSNNPIDLFSIQNQPQPQPQPQSFNQGPFGVNQPPIQPQPQPQQNNSIASSITSLYQQPARSSLGQVNPMMNNPYMGNPMGPINPMMGNPMMGMGNPAMGNPNMGMGPMGYPLNMSMGGVPNMGGVQNMGGAPNMGGIPNMGGNPMGSQMGNIYNMGQPGNNQGMGNYGYNPNLAGNNNPSNLNLGASLAAQQQEKKPFDDLDDMLGLNSGAPNKDFGKPKQNVNSNANNDFDLF